MDNIRSPFENIFNIIGGLPQGHEKPLKHALYNALALLLLFLSCAAGWALYIILEPFIKPLIWALLVGSVLHPLKYSLSTKFRSWLNKLDESHTPIAIGVLCLPIDITNDLSEFIGSKLLKHLKIILAVVTLIPASLVIYYYTPNFFVNILWYLCMLIHVIINWFIEISSTTLVIVILVGYVSFIGLCWRPATNYRFHLAGMVMWLVLSLYLAHLGSAFQVYIFCAIQLLFACGFYVEVYNIQEEMNNAGHQITIIESISMALHNKPIAETDSKPSESRPPAEVQTEPQTEPPPEPTLPKPKDQDPWSLELFETAKNGEESQGKATSDADASVKRVKFLKPQRSLSHPSPLTMINRFNKKTLDKSYLATQSPDISEPLMSDVYLYFLFWACGIMLLWKNITLLPLLPLPIIFYVVKHSGNYLGLWQLLRNYFRGIANSILGWCDKRCDAFVPVPVRGLYKIMLKINSVSIDAVKHSIDSVSSILVITGLIVFLTCASVFFAIQIYAEAIMLVQTTGNVINSTVVHNPELRQMLPPSLDETLDSVLDNAYQYGREGISKLVRGMMNDVDSAKSAKLEQQVLELWDRVYQAWMSSDSINGPQVTTDAVQNSWHAFINDIRKSPEMFNVQGLVEFVKQNIGTFMSVVESLWAIFKGNLSIVVGSFSALLSILLGGGTAVLNFILNVIVFLTTLFYLLSSSGVYYKPVEIITKFSPHNGNRFGLALEAAVNGVFKASLKMAVFYGLWTWLIHNLFSVKIVYLPSALATVLGAVPFLGTYWAAIPAILDLWLAQSCPFKAVLLAIFQFLPSFVVDTTIYKEIKGGSHPYLTGLAIAGGIFCLGFEGAIIGPMLLCGLYVVIDLSSNLFKETPSEEVAPLQIQHLSRKDPRYSIAPKYN